MSIGFKIFLVVFLVSLPLFWGINLLERNLEEFFFWQKMAKDPKILAAQINQEILEQKLRNLKPIRDQTIKDLEIEARSAISVLVDLSNPNQTSRILFEKNSQEKLPIASLTKLMTAYLVLENYNLEEIVEISKRAVEQEGEFGNLKIGEKFKIKDLLYLLLIESSNDAAYALAEVIGENGFVQLMNLEAKNLELKNTYFVNPTGLDPDLPSDPQNLSTARDLIKLIKVLLNKPLLWEMLSLPKFDLYSPDGIFHHQLKNTNELLVEGSFKTKIIGGKTGWTPEALGCLVLVLEAPKSKGLLINIILGSKNRFQEMKNLINWLYRAYKW